MADKPLYKVIFLNHGKVYELFARSVTAADTYGFVEVAGLEFDRGSKLVIDPAEERMREEFEDAEALFLPMHSVIRYERVSRRGTCRIRDANGKAETVTPFPMKPQRQS